MLCNFDPNVLLLRRFFSTRSDVKLSMLKHALLFFLDGAAVTKRQRRYLFVVRL